MPTRAFPVIACCVLALASAMGIGRFAFTPLLPLMLRDGTLAAGAGAAWAAANYGGYLLGALTAARFARRPAQGLRLALLGVALATLPMAWLGADAPAPAGMALRTVAGVCSAWALVCASAWGLGALAQRGGAALGAWIYTGVGLGIALAGLLAWQGGFQPAATLWLELGLAALAAAVLVALWAGSARAVPAPAPGAKGAAGGHWGLVFCYGGFGFGYILPATFLPAMAREQVADPLVFGITWPLFGLAAMLSVAAVALWLRAWPRRRVWAVAQAVMALGAALPVVSQALWALAAAAVLVGSTFMVATMAGLQLAREQRPSNPTPLLARMTAAFALGQIAGPVLVHVLDEGWAGWDALALSHAAAALLLAVTAAWLWLGKGSTHPEDLATMPNAFPEAGLPERLGPPATLTAPQKAAAQALIDGPRGGVYGPFRPLLHCPPLLHATAALGEALRYGGTLAAPLREWTICVVAREQGNVFEWEMHRPLALKAGVPEGALVALGAGQASPPGLADELVLARQVAAELLARHRLAETTYAAALARWGEPQLVELLTLIGYFAMVCWLMNVARTPGPKA